MYVGQLLLVGCVFFQKAGVKAGFALLPFLIFFLQCCEGGLGGGSLLVGRGGGQVALQEFLLPGVALGKFEALQLIAGVFLEQGFCLCFYLRFNVVLLAFNHLALAVSYVGVVAGYSLAALF